MDWSKACFCLCSAISSASFPPEVITYDQWMQLKPEYKNMLSGWIKGAFRSGKKEMQESINEKLNFVLNTAPTSDRSVVLRIFLFVFMSKFDDVCRNWRETVGPTVCPEVMYFRCFCN